MLICGIDEAGRGPVIGPMVFAAVVIDKEKEAELIELGVTDSKMLDVNKREELFGKVLEIAHESKILQISAKEIDEWMASASLNDVEAIKCAELIDSLDCDPDVTYVDSPDTIPERYGNNIKNLMHKKSDIISEHKADMNYISVGASSILAKVTRDREIDALKKEYGELGSGYPSDELTKKWIDEYFKEHKNFPDCVRKKWSTVSNKLQQRLTEW